LLKPCTHSCAPCDIAQRVKERGKGKERREREWVGGREMYKHAHMFFVDEDCVAVYGNADGLLSEVPCEGYRPFVCGPETGTVRTDRKTPRGEVLLL